MRLSLTSALAGLLVLGSTGCSTLSNNYSTPREMTPQEIKGHNDFREMALRVKPYIPHFPEQRLIPYMLV